MGRHKKHIAYDKLDESLPLVLGNTLEVPVARKKAGLLVDLRLERLPGFNGWRARGNGLHAKRLREQGFSAQPHENQQGTGHGPNCCCPAGCAI